MTTIHIFLSLLAIYVLGIATGAAAVKGPFWAVMLLGGIAGLVSRTIHNRMVAS